MIRRYPARQRFMTRCKRCNLVGAPPFTGRAFIAPELKQAVLAIDPQIELIEVAGNVHCYRVKTYGTSPQQDVLVWQFELKYPPGLWLIDCLNQADQWKKHGTPEKAAKKQLEQYTDRSVVREQQMLLRVSEISEAVAPELTRYFDRGYKVFGPGGRRG